MAGKRRQRKIKPSPKPAEPGPVRRWWAGLPADEKRAAAGRMAAVALVIGAAVGAVVGLGELRGYVMAQPSYADSTAVVVLADRPDWMVEAVAAELRARLSRAAGPRAETFEPHLAERVYAEARRCPWIRRVHEVRIERAAAGAEDQAMSAGRIVVDAEYRRPVARAVRGPIERYIDDQGVVLPTDSARLQAMRWPMVRITGLREPAPDCGRVWPGEDLTAGLKILGLLAGKPYFNQITTIDVGNFRGRYSRAEASILLEASDGLAVTEIRFGDLPSDGLPPVGVPSIERRLGYLDSWHRRNGGRLAGPTYLDLRQSDAINVPEGYVP